MSITGISSRGLGAFSFANQRENDSGAIRRQLAESTDGGGGFASPPKGFSIAKAGKALDELSKNFDTIDVDGNGTLSRDELSTYAKDNGISGSPGRGVGSEGLSKERIQELKGKVEKLGSLAQGGNPADIIAAKRAEAEQQGGLSNSVLANLSGSQTVQAQSSGENGSLQLLTELIPDVEEKKEKEKEEEESKSDEDAQSGVSLGASLRIQSYGAQSDAEGIRDALAAA